MNVVVDTSVWSLALRRRAPDPSPAIDRLERLIAEGEALFLLGVILQELLQGVRSTRDFNLLLERLTAFPLIEPKRSDYVDAARLRNHCQSKGVQAGTVDFLVAAICIRSRCALFTTDKDFAAIAQHSPLRLF